MWLAALLMVMLSGGERNVANDILNYDPGSSHKCGGLGGVVHIMSTNLAHASLRY